MSQYYAKVLKMYEVVVGKGLIDSKFAVSIYQVELSVDTHIFLKRISLFLVPRKWHV